MILDGKKVANEIKEDIKNEIAINNYCPSLATILVGNDKASITYVNMKEKACLDVGIKPLIIRMDENTTTIEIIKKIKELNDDKKVNGILIQHPLPNHIDEALCFNTINIEKDVDGLNTTSFGNMAMNINSFTSATSLGIITLLKYYKIDISSMNVVVVGRSQILGKPMAMMLLNENATVTICHSKTKNLKEHLLSADLIVAAIGKAKYIKKDCLKKDVILVDAGYNDGNIGDIDLENAKNISSYYTPVPGGVGPMTIASLLKQTLSAYKNQNKDIVS